HRAAVAERVGAVGRPAGGAHALEQQQLVAAVGERVQGLGEHGARAGEERPDALGCGDDDVDRERLQDLAGRLARHAYLITLDSARNSSEPARPSRSNTEASVDVMIAPARAIRPRPISRLAGARLATASAQTCAVQPRAT